MRPTVSGFARGPTLTHRRKPLSAAAATAAAGIPTRPMAMQALWEKAMMLAPARVITEVSNFLAFPCCCGRGC